ncbi:SCO family protein [Litchfieldia alkalitelluris]|uniref:SCO family protein n=1 Tax=Litchfieldia alkalitelluris TaxID=304268 RepID=UPI0009976C8A|nr:SCO family protein [Litchfieldia alkalitelluris]
MNIKSILLSIIVLLFITACSPKPSIEEIEQSFPMNLSTGDIEAVNQNNEPFTLKNLEGKVWLASFIFTNCETVCSPMTATMSKLQTQLKEAGIQDIELISFSIDPENDTTEVLRTFGEEMDADFSNWQFLTGYTQDEIESFANTSFLSPAARIDESDQFIHSTSIYLINQRGTVLKQYDAVAATPFEEIIEDIQKLK